MSHRFTRQQAAQIISGDSEFVLEAIEHGVIECDGDTLVAVQVERIRVAHTLVRDLEVNWAGVEIILRMREEILTTRGQMGELGELLVALAGDSDHGEER